MRSHHHCTVTEPPRIEDGAVVFPVIYDPSGRAFACRMRGFGQVEVDPIPHDATTIPDAEARARVAEEARDFAEENRDEFARLFAELDRANR